MEALIRGRPYILTAFFIALGAVFASPFVNQTWLTAVAIPTAHLALLLFLATESFGPIAQRRSGASRWVARVFFALSALVVGGFAAHVLLGLVGDGT